MAEEPRQARPPGTRVQINMEELNRRQRDAPPVWNGVARGVADRFEAEVDLDPVGLLNGRVILLGPPRMLEVEGDFSIQLNGCVYPPGYRPSWDKAKEAEAPPEREKTNVTRDRPRFYATEVPPLSPVPGMHLTPLFEKDHEESKSAQQTPCAHGTKP